MYGRVPQALLYESENVLVILCPFCENRLQSPFSGEMHWRKWEVIIRLFEECPQCMIKLQVKFAKRIPVRVPEWWEGVPVDEDTND
jgi:hypothetical protein